MIRGQLSEIVSGEGKYMVIAMIATFYELLGVDTMIVCYGNY